MPTSLTVYKASAGSGKTFTLATEYIKLLVANPENYKNILAVTFTNKATDEMKTRILSQLYGISKGLPSSDAYLENIRTAFATSGEPVCHGEKALRDLTDTEIRRRAGIALHNLMHNYSYFRVETIDSFFQSVLRNLARELDLTANLRVELNDKEVEETAVDKMIQHLDRKSAVLQWIMEYISTSIDDDRSWNVISSIKKFGTTIFKDFYKRDSDTIANKLSNPEFFVRYTASIKSVRDDAKKTAKSFCDTFFKELAHADISPNELSGKARGISSYFTKLEKCDFSDKKCKTKTLEKHLQSAEAWAAKKNPNRGYIISVVEEKLMPLLYDVESRRPELWRHYKSAILTLKHLDKVRLLSNIEHTVREINQDANSFLLSDTQQLLSLLIEDSDSPFIYEKIGTRLEHIMIDEFQDTSTVQWHNFKVLLHDTMSRSSHGNLIVGDVKQSIYRWRDGDWRLLNDIERQFGNAEDTIDVQTLGNNFRSQRNIVDFNNAFFEAARDISAKEEADINPSGAEEIKKAYEDVRQQVPGKKEPNGIVTVTLLPNDDYEERTLEITVRHVEELIAAGTPLNAIAILVRKNKQIPVIADYFAAKHPEISIVSDEAFRLDASSAVLTIVNAMMAMTHPREPLYLANLSKLYLEALGNDISTSQTSEIALPDAFVNGQKGLMEMPLTDLVEKLYDIFNLENFNDQSAYISAFNDCMSTFAADNYADIRTFLNKWETTYRRQTIPSDSIDGIRILSIHKSKGLEYDNVIVPFCDWELERRRDNILWCVPKEAPFSNMPLVPIDYSADLIETIYADDYRQEHTQNIVDNLNLLYVAFTRAKNNLFVIGKRDAKNSRSTLLQAVLPMITGSLKGSACTEGGDNEPLTFSFGNMAPTIVKKEKSHDESGVNVFTQQSAPEMVSIKTYPRSVTFVQSNKSHEFITTEEGETLKANYIEIGNILHNIFSRIRTTADIEPVLGELEADGLIYDDYITPAKVRQLLDRGFENAMVRDWFSGSWELFNECSIVYKDEQNELQTRRPDRVMTDGKTTIVVDFKFGNKNGEHIRQVQQYMRLLAGMGYEDVKGYLWYVNLNEIREVNEDESIS